MNTRLFLSLADCLLKKHFGIGIDDTGLAAEAGYHVAHGRRPFEVINEIAEGYDLDRIDSALGHGCPSKRPLTATDEGDALATVETVIVMGEQPTTCPECGVRTEYEALGECREHHRCRTADCGYEFICENEECLEVPFWAMSYRMVLAETAIAVKESFIAAARTGSDIDRGRAMAYRHMLDLLRARAEDYEVGLDEIGLADFDPDGPLRSGV